MGGTVCEAKDRLNLGAVTNAACLHIRSPLHSTMNAETHSLDVCRRRESGEARDLSHLVLPLNCYLKGRPLGRDPDPPPRTWTSELFHHIRSTAPQIAEACKDYILRAIHALASDPKGNDDVEGGGEWFVGWLRAAHREIYDDIDHSDCAELLSQKWAKSLDAKDSGKSHKHNLGELQVPSCQQAFEEIVTLDTDAKISERVEVQAKILIDIYMAQLVDFASLLTILRIVTNSADAVSSGGDGCVNGGGAAGKRKVVIVCYMGSMHTKAVERFFCDAASAKRGGFLPMVCERFYGRCCFSRVVSVLSLLLLC